MVKTLLGSVQQHNSATLRLSCKNIPAGLQSFPLQYIHNTHIHIDVHHNEWDEETAARPQMLVGSETKAMKERQDAEVEVTVMKMLLGKGGK